jgi:hypothetical protein
MLSEEKLDENGVWCPINAKGLLDPYISETINSQWYVTHIMTPLLNTYPVRIELPYGVFMMIE